MSSTPPAPTDAYAARLAELRQRFRARLPAQLTVIHKYAKQLHRGELAPAELKPLRIELHSLAGSAGAFGETQLGAKAKALENWLIELERGALSDAAPLARELLAFTSIVDGDGEPLA